MRLQIYEPDVHAQLPSERSESQKKLAPLIDCGTSPQSPADRVDWTPHTPDIPKLREDGQIRARGFRVMAEPESVGEIPALIIAEWGDLEQCNSKVHFGSTYQTRFGPY